MAALIPRPFTKAQNTISFLTPQAAGGQTGSLNRPVTSGRQFIPRRWDRMLELSASLLICSSASAVPNTIETTRNETFPRHRSVRDRFASGCTGPCFVGCWYLSESAGIKRMQSSGAHGLDEGQVG